MKIKDGYILRTIADDNVVLPSGDELDLSIMITLNDTGRLLWERLEKGAEADDLVAALLAEYDVDETTARAGVDAFLEKLKANDLLA